MNLTFLTLAHISDINQRGIYNDLMQKFRDEGHSYLEDKMPILCATDVNTDIGKIAEENGYGYWCESVKPEDFTALVDKMLAADRKAMGEKGYEFLKENYLVSHTYNAIMKHLKP